MQKPKSVAAIVFGNFISFVYWILYSNLFYLYKFLNQINFYIRHITWSDSWFGRLVVYVERIISLLRDLAFHRRFPQRSLVTLLVDSWRPHIRLDVCFYRSTKVLGISGITGYRLAVVFWVFALTGHGWIHEKIGVCCEAGGFPKQMAGILHRCTWPRKKRGEMLIEAQNLSLVKRPYVFLCGTADPILHSEIAVHGASATPWTKNTKVFLVGLQFHTKWTIHRPWKCFLVWVIIFIRLQDSKLHDSTLQWIADGASVVLISCLNDSFKKALIRMKFFV